MSPALITETLNEAARAMDAAPALSVLIPFFNDDPSRLIARLDGEGADIEILALDDGCPDGLLNDAVKRAVQTAETPARLVTARTNLGRSAGRNVLAARARGTWLLFLDADMEIEAGFIETWLEIARRDDFDAAFGGFELPATIAPEHRVHAVLARAGDIASVEARTRKGPAAVCSSNLLVRRALIEETPFAEDFTGWGWEDVDWALRAARAGRLIHVDNPARHAGLEPVPGLLAKFAAAGPNFARVLSRHGELAGLPAARAARALKSLPGRTLVRALSRGAASSAILPASLRARALKLYRAACAAEALS